MNTRPRGVAVAGVLARVSSWTHITAYILGAGASAHAGYPLASGLLQALSDWLDRADESEQWVAGCRNRIVQVRETFGSLDDFKSILGKLEAYGHERVKPTGPVTYVQDHKDIFHDCTEHLDDVNTDVPVVSRKSIWLILGEIQGPAICAAGDIITSAMTAFLDPLPFNLIALSGWMSSCQSLLIDYLREANRVLREQLGDQRLRFTDDQRRRLAVRAKGLGRKMLMELGTLTVSSTEMTGSRLRLASWSRKVGYRIKAGR